MTEMPVMSELVPEREEVAQRTPEVLELRLLPYQDTVAETVPVPVILACTVLGPSPGAITSEVVLVVTASWSVKISFLIGDKLVSCMIIPISVKM